jgi:prevent-host-death family protein
MHWQVQEAKQRFSELVRRTLEEGPQVVTRHGEEVVVIVAADEYRRSQARSPEPDFKEFLLSGPDLSQLDLTRTADHPRDIDFGFEDE